MKVDAVLQSIQRPARDRCHTLCTRDLTVQVEWPSSALGRLRPAQHYLLLLLCQVCIQSTHLSAAHQPDRVLEVSLSSSYLLNPITFQYRSKLFSTCCYIICLEIHYFWQKRLFYYCGRGGGVWPHLQTHFVDMNLFYSFVIFHLPFLASG